MHLVDQFSKCLSADDINTDDPENIILFKYYDIEELQNLKITKRESHFLYFI